MVERLKNNVEKLTGDGVERRDSVLHHLLRHGGPLHHRPVGRGARPLLGQLESQPARVHGGGRSSHLPHVRRRDRRHLRAHEEHLSVRRGRGLRAPVLRYHDAVRRQNQRDHDQEEHARDVRQVQINSERPGVEDCVQRAEEVPVLRPGWPPGFFPGGRLADQKGV